MQIQIDALEQARQVEDPIAPPLKHFDLIVESFDKAAAITIDKVVGDLLLPLRQGLDEPIKTCHSRRLHPSPPVPDFLLRLLLRQILFKDRAQLLTISVGLLQLRAVFKQQIEHLLFFRLQIRFLLSESPHRPLQFFVLLLRQLFLQSALLLFA